MNNRPALNHRRKGAVNILAALALTFIMIAVGIAVSTMGFRAVTSAEKQENSTKARIYAEGGAKDALRRISKDKTYTCASDDCYTISFVANGCSANEGCARVSVSSASGTVANPKVINSEGRVGDVVREIKVEVMFDPNLDGRIATTTWSEV